MFALTPVSAALARLAACACAGAQEVIRIVRTECGGRLHWGKAGWPQWAACFDGAREYPDTWCHFGCAVQARAPAAQRVRWPTSRRALLVHCKCWAGMC
jgi:coenzyme F420-reducing hydrogenase delta subunit